MISRALITLGISTKSFPSSIAPRPAHVLHVLIVPLCLYAVWALDRIKNIKGCSHAFLALKFSAIRSPFFHSRTFPPTTAIHSSNQPIMSKESPLFYQTDSRKTIQLDDGLVMRWSTTADTDNLALLLGQAFRVIKSDYSLLSLQQPCCFVCN